MYVEHGLEFNFGEVPIGATCNIRYVDGEAVLASIGTGGISNIITDFYMMEDARYIYIKNTLHKPIDKERAERISKFENLEMISFGNISYVEGIHEFAKIINKNNPECKIIVKGEEFILPD